MRPYLVGGGGVYRRHVEVGRPVGAGGVAAYDPLFGLYDEASTEEAAARSRTQTQFGLNGGGGLEVPAAGARASVEARYHDALTAARAARHTGLVPIPVGLRW